MRDRATADDRVARQLASHPDYETNLTPDGPGRWKLVYSERGDRFAEVQIDESQARPVDVYTGPQVEWQMARGVPGAFGRKVNALYVWVPLMFLFFFAFFDWRRPFKLLHLDLLVLLSFSLSQVYFNRGQIDTSVPLAYLPLVYLLLRMLAAVFVPGSRPRPGAVKTLVPVTWLAIALVFLICFRGALNTSNSNMIDVGYSGVIGADLITQGDSPYGNFPKDNPSGDTYGPVAYYAYIPAELIAPWGGKWDDLPAAHGAAVAFDLLVIVALFFVGRRIRGPGRAGNELGVVLAYAWSAFPYTLLVMNSNANDSLVAALLVFAFLAAGSRAGRGALLALATATKFAPAVLVPLFAFYRQRRFKDALVFLASFVATALVVTVFLLPDGGPRELWDRTLAFQLDRDSPFSIWGQYPGLSWLHVVVEVGVAVLALTVALIPKYKTPLALAALAAALLIAAQLTVEHWFYLYIVWWLPFVLIALLARPSEPNPRPEPAR